MSKIAYNIVDTGVTIFYNGKIYSATKGQPHYAQVLKVLAAEDYEKIPDIFNVRKSIEKFSDGGLQVTKDTISFNGVPLHGVLVDKILSGMSSGAPYKPFLNFLKKLLSNPNPKSIEELFEFLQHKDLPITPEGNFLAYKGVQADYYSITGGSIKPIKGIVNEQGQIFNGVGEEIIVERKDVDDNENRHCSFGLHAGSYEYADGFKGSGGHLMIVEINPRDAVSVPTDANRQKLRACAYKVVGEYGVTPLKEAVCDQFSDEKVVTEELNFHNIRGKDGRFISKAKRAKLKARRKADRKARKQAKREAKRKAQKNRR